MVSQLEPLERTLALRRPPSLSSRTSTTRRHRHNRSHHGGSSSRSSNEFPVFGQTGDVEIVIRAGGREQRYMLHRLILAQCSGFFEAGTSQEWSRQGHELAVVGEDATVRPTPSRAMTAPVTGAGRIKWRYELDGGTEDDEVPMLVQKVDLHSHQRKRTRMGGLTRAIVISRQARPSLVAGATTNRRHVHHRRRRETNRRGHSRASSERWPTSRSCTYHHHHHDRA